MAKKTNNRRIRRFAFRPGLIVAGKYEIMAQIGTGWEGEVYLLRECATGIERAAKFWYPHRNRRNQASRFYAKKLHKLRHCPILIQYHTQETITCQDQPVRFLVSEYVEGELLSDFVARQPGKRMPVFQALHLLHALAAGIENPMGTRQPRKHPRGRLQPDPHFLRRHRRTKVVRQAALRGQGHLLRPETLADPQEVPQRRAVAAVPRDDAVGLIRRGYADRICGSAVACSADPLPGGDAGRKPSGNRFRSVTRADEVAEPSG